MRLKYSDEGATIVEPTGNWIILGFQTILLLLGIFAIINGIIGGDIPGQAPAAVKIVTGTILYLLFPIFLLAGGTGKAQNGTRLWGITLLCFCPPVLTLYAGTRR